jgi:hypothetical protein
VSGLKAGGAREIVPSLCRVLVERVCGHVQIDQTIRQVRRKRDVQVWLINHVRVVPIVVHVHPAYHGRKTEHEHTRHQTNLRENRSRCGVPQVGTPLIIVWLTLPVLAATTNCVGYGLFKLATPMMTGRLKFNCWANIHVCGQPTIPEPLNAYVPAWATTLVQLGTAEDTTQQYR